MFIQETDNEPRIATEDTFKLCGPRTAKKVGFEVLIKKHVSIEQRKLLGYLTSKIPVFPRKRDRKIILKVSSSSPKTAVMP